MVITEHLREGHLEHELAKIEDPRMPPVPVDVRATLPGETRDVVLHGWSSNPRGVEGTWGLVTGVREYADGFWAEFCWWVPAENVRRR